jgi:hypothetical protein
MMAYMRLGDTEQAFSWMKKTVEEPSWFALQLRVNPLLDPLRSDPRFEALLSQVFSKNRRWKAELPQRRYDGMGCQ